MKVCFVVTEYFGWGQIGGFGHLSRKITKHLAEAGIDTHVIMQKSEYEPQPSYSNIDGVHVHAFRRRTLLSHFGLTRNPKKLAQDLKADVYHAQAMNVWAFHVQRAVPNAKHLLTCQDPQIGWIWKRWKKSPIFFMEVKKRGKPRKLASRVFRDTVYDWMQRMSLYQADLVGCQAKYLIPLVQDHYHLPFSPIFLPNPIDIKPHKIEKSATPSVLFLARIDPVKRVWIFLKIAKHMPKVQFYLAGKCHDARYQKMVLRVVEKIPNLKYLGYVLDAEKEAILDKSWFYLNCSLKEGLPVAFLEASAHKCAIISHMNPDHFAWKFGAWINQGEGDYVPYYVSAIQRLIDREDVLQKRQEAGYQYVLKHHETRKVIRRHIDVYKKLLESER